MHEACIRVGLMPSLFDRHFTHCVTKQRILLTPDQRAMGHWTRGIAVPSTNSGSASDLHPVLLNALHSSRPCLQMMLPGLDVDDCDRAWNLNAEQLAVDQRLWEAFRHRRCLIPASAFVIDRRKPTGEVEPLLLSCPSTPVFSLAGVWMTFLDDHERELAVFQVITVQAPPFLQPFVDDFPVIVSDAGRDRWLCCADATLPINLLRPLSTMEMKSWAMSPVGSKLWTSSLEGRQQVA